MPYTIKNSRPGLGMGLFAIGPIELGSFVIEYTGKKIPTSLADSLKTRYLFEIDKDWTIDGESEENIARYINHSCDPNCEAEIQEGRIMINAIRDIEPGEEISIDYGEEYFKEFIQPAGCKCEKCVKETAASR